MDTQVAIVGGGPAGLAAALTLSRSMIRSIVFDKQTPSRNASSPFVASLPGFDKKVPADFRAAIRRNISGYGYSQFEDAGISDLRREEKCFTLSKDDGSTVTAEIVLLSTGMVDILPDLEGIETFWGRSVINCPFCHGIEWRNKRWGIYAHRTEVVDAAEIYRNWSDDLTYFLDPEIPVSPERLEQISGLSKVVHQKLPYRLGGEDERLGHAELHDGQVVDLDCLLVYPHQRQSDFVSALDISRTDAGYIEVDEGFRTSSNGVYAAGDIVYAGHQNTPTALHMGNMAAATIVMDYSFKK